MTITALPASIDLTSGQTQDVVVANTGTTTESGIALDNSMAGVEVSENGASGPWSTGVTAFDLDAAVVDKLTNPANVYYSDPDIIFPYIAPGGDYLFIDVGVGFFAANKNYKFEINIDLDSQGGPSHDLGIFGAFEQFNVADSTAQDLIGISYSLNLSRGYKVFTRSRTVSYTSVNSGNLDITTGYKLTVILNQSANTLELFIDDVSQGTTVYRSLENIRYLVIGKVGMAGIDYFCIDGSMSSCEGWQSDDLTFSDDEKLIDVGYDGSDFILNQSSVAESKTLTFRHDANTITTSNTDTTFSIDGSNSVTVTPTIDNPDMDLTNEQTKDLTIENLGTTTESGITLDNSVAGVEVSENGVSGPWSAGVTAFDLGPSVPPTVPIPDPEGLWKFDGDVTADSSGNSHTLTNNGVTLTLDRNGNSNSAADFIGSESDYLAVPQLFSNTSEWTFACWVKNNYIITDKWLYEWNVDDFASYLKIGGNIITGQVATSAGSVTVAHTVANWDEWTHIAITAKESTGNIKLYVNGAEEDSNAISGTFLNGAGDNLRVIGIDRGLTASRYYNGDMDEVYIYTDQLSSDQILAIYYEGAIASTKTLTFRHDPKYLATTSPDTTFSVDGTNSITVTPTKDAFEGLDLITNAIDYLYAQNTTGSGITVTSNAISGLEWSADGVNFFNGADSFAVGANDITQRWYRYDEDNRTITLPATLTLTDDALNSVEFLPSYKPLADLGTAPEGSCTTTTKFSVVNNDTISRNVDFSVSGEFHSKLETESAWLSVIPTFAIPAGETKVIDVRGCPATIGAKAGTGTLTYNPTILIGLSALGVGFSKLHSLAIQRRLPTGRAWNGEVMKGVLNGISSEFNTAEDNATAIADINNILFNDKLEAWQNVLGLIPAGTLTEQNNDVVRKLRDIGGITAQDIEDSLQAAGFDVYVHLNHFEGTDDQFLLGGASQLGGAAYLTAPKVYGIDPRPYLNSSSDFSLGNPGSFLGSAYLQTPRQSNIVVNSILASEDEKYRSSITDTAAQINWQYIFFIGGQTFGTSTDVDTDREAEFRRLILELKPLGMMVILLINYI